MNGQHFLTDFNTTIITLTLVGYETIVANSALLASLAVQRALVE